MKQQQEAKKKQESKSSFSFFSSSKKEKVKVAEEERDIEQDYEDMDEIHSLQTTEKKLEVLRRESQQLFFSLAGASIFFKRTDVET